MSKPLDNQRILDICRYFCVLGLVIPLLITWKLWTSERVYPMTPLVEGASFAFISGNASFAVYAIGMLTLTAALFKKFALPALATYLTIVAFWIMQDISRNLIWVYMYNCVALTLLAWSIYQKRHHTQQDPGYINNIRAIICGTYIWGGINKINSYFFGSVFPWFISPIIPNITDYELGALFTIVVPFLEIFIGFGLMFLKGKERTLPLFIAFGMLCYNLYCLGPLGHNWGISVWSWNLFIFLFTFLLFWKQGNDVNLKSVLFPKTWLKWPIIICIYIGPATWYWGIWPTHNSFLMYDGVRQEASYDIAGNLHHTLPDILKEVTQKHGNKVHQHHWLSLIHI